MDWKAWYRDEAESEAGRAAVADAIARFPDGDPDIRRCLASGGAVSFPHTTLRDSAEPLARVATSIVAGAVKRVVALGVLHASSGGNPAKEFSLDLFSAVLAAAAAARVVAPPDVRREFVGPDSGLGVAAALRPLLGPGVALVATGDLVHAGHGYSTPEEAAALPSDAEALRSHFESRAREMLEAAFAPGSAARADAIAREIRSDQRHVLPALAALVGERARPRLLAFRLTDYGPILGRPPPCVVATALYVCEPPGR